MTTLRYVLKFMFVVGSVLLPETQAAEHADPPVQVRSRAGIVNQSAFEQHSEGQPRRSGQVFSGFRQPGDDLFANNTDSADQWEAPVASTQVITKCSDEMICDGCGTGCTSQDQRIAQLEAEVEDLRQSLGSHITQTPQSVFHQPCHACPQWSGGVEVTLLQPHISGSMPLFLGDNTGRAIDPDFDGGIRYVLAYRSSQGLGIRGRYWSYNNSVDFAAPFQPAVMSINAEAADVDLTQLANLGRWQLESNAGVRYGKFGYHSPIEAAFGVGDVNFQGFGPTLALNTRRPLGQTGFCLVGNLRGSLLFGEIDNAAMLPIMPAGTIQGEVAQSIETQLGAAWTKTFTNNSQLQLRMVWETQYWMNDTLADDALGIGSNLGLMGPTIAAELRF